MTLQPYKKIALVFPGQGSQSVGMLSELAAKFQVVKEVYAKASVVLGYDLWQLVAFGPEEQLNQTMYTQPALLAGEVAMWRILHEQLGIRPTFFCGHSLGEYSALVAASAFDFSDAIKLVAERGRLMQQAVGVGVGKMAAIAGLSDEQIIEICKQAAQGEILTPANYNAISQIVISGAAEAVERAVVMAKAAGAKLAKILPVSVPAHCELMKPAAEKLAEYLNFIDIKIPSTAVISNVDVTVYKSADVIRESLVRQLCSSVRWVETIQFLFSYGVDCLVECGPGKVLAGLNKRIVDDLPTLSGVQLLL
jgi:[acyl-carrier-protein] S-malonyltransferase